MRIFLLMTIAFSTLGGGCDESMHGNFYDLGSAPFKHIGDSCQPDVPPTSECGYAPQFYCSKSRRCAAACTTNADCGDGSACVGSGDMTAGECRLPESPKDGGND